jgi:branched-chain amino acid transport system substrate-binding protein
VFIIQSKAKGANEADVFDVIATDEPDEAQLRTCQELGHS